MTGIEIDSVCQNRICLVLTDAEKGEPLIILPDKAIIIHAECYILVCVSNTSKQTSSSLHIPKIYINSLVLELILKISSGFSSPFTST